MDIDKINGAPLYVCQWVFVCNCPLNTPRSCLSDHLVWPGGTVLFLPIKHHLITVISLHTHTQTF